MWPFLIFFAFVGGVAYLRGRHAAGRAAPSATPAEIADGLAALRAFRDKLLQPGGDRAVFLEQGGTQTATEAVISTDALAKINVALALGQQAMIAVRPLEQTERDALPATVKAALAETGAQLLPRVEAAIASLTARSTS